MSFCIGSGQIHAVGVVFQAGCPHVGFIALAIAALFLAGSPVRRGIGGGNADAIDDLVAGRQTEAVAVSFAVGAGIVFVLALILQRELQAVDQAEEVVVTVGSHAVGAPGHKVVGFDIGIIAKFRQHIRPGADVIDNAVVAAVVE
ncbi:hypothetical protein D3C76_1315270 [compost metagenome]